MKLTNILTPGIAAILLFSLNSCDSETIEPAADVATTAADTSITADVTSITEDEAFGLAFMREEEKLARDVYTKLFEIYDNRIFNNISKSEEKHMDEMLKLLDTYDIPDPALPEIGDFVDTSLQQLYINLMVQGNDSEIAALIVGATIEDVDIRDLDLFITKTTNTDIIQAYEFLNCGSRNHLRAFVSQLDSLGVTYTPQFITQEQFDNIISGENEKCGQSYFN